MTSWTRALRGAFVFAASASITTTAAAATITIDSTTRGYYTDAGVRATGTTANYLAGACCANDGFGHIYRDFFIFALPSFGGEAVVGAKLVLSNPRTANDPGSGFGAGGVGGSPNFRIYDVSTPIAALTGSNPSTVSTFADLGTGTQFGAIAFDLVALRGANVEIPLNAFALAAIGAGAGGSIAFGGDLATTLADKQFIFSGTSGVLPSGTQLVIETRRVDEPAGLALLFSALAAAAFVRRGRRAAG